ncbi:hypothetical protein ABZ260_38520, partial [Streptosporangium sp. NPDC006013]|uniref:hypothetical protein n=1 Tax=Streptosporangium sp. NPDC006013 TaxID=3155596 RepID=UPI0033A17730
ERVPEVFLRLVVIDADGQAVAREARAPAGGRWTSTSSPNTRPARVLQTGVPAMNPPKQDPLTALRQAFPGWYIDHDTTLGRWIAMRYRPLTSQETKAGAKYFLQRACLERLSTALADQRELARRTRTAP